MKQRNQSYEFYHHREVWGVAKNLLLDHPGQDCLTFAATLMWYFTMEGYINWLREVIQPILSDEEQTFLMPHGEYATKGIPTLKINMPQRFRGTVGKLRFLTEKFHLTPWIESERPFITIKNFTTISQKSKKGWTGWLKSSTRRV